MATWQGWESDVLTAIGAPITAANVAFLDAWAQAEGGTAAYNPLNTTQTASGSSDYNSAGVQDFTSPTQGANATATTLENGYYPALLAGLQSGNPLSGDVASMESELSTWGTGPGFLQSLIGGSANVPGAAGSGPETSGGIPTVKNQAVSSHTMIGVAVVGFLLIVVAVLAMHGTKKATA